MIVSEEVAHILFHVEAEAGDSDASQAPGVIGRANKVRSFLQPLLNDNRDMTRKEILVLFENLLTQSALKTEILSLDHDDEGQRLRHVFTSWVGKNRMVNRG